MDPDFALVIGLVLGGFSIPAMMSAVTDGRTPKATSVVLLAAFGLVVFAVTQQPGGYAMADIPDVFIGVISHLVP